MARNPAIQEANPRAAHGGEKTGRIYDMARPTKILFLTANPSDTAALRLDEEIREIGQRIRRGEYRRLFEIRTAPAIRATDLQYELRDAVPDVVHFSGHGSDAGELLFVRDGDRSSQPIPSKTLARVFKQFRDQIRCVVLNACYSAAQAAAIAESIPCVVGMTREVRDTTALAFAAGFYEALAFGSSIAAAVEAGQTQVELSDPDGVDEAEIPKLIARSDVDANSIQFVRSNAVTDLPGRTEGRNQSSGPAQSQRFGSIQISGEGNSLQIGQTGSGDGAQVQRIGDLRIGGKGNPVLIEQKKR